MPERKNKGKGNAAALENVIQNGSFVFPNGDQYEGEYKLSQGVIFREGDGIHITPGLLRYEGHWVADKMDGYGKLEFETGAIYEGEFKENKFHGQGSYRFLNGSLYSGDFSENKLLGNGEFTDTDKQVWTGKFDYRAALGLRFKVIS